MKTHRTHYHMHYPDEKGTRVNHAEHRAQRPPAITGRFAMLANLIRERGGSAPSLPRAKWCLFVLPVALTAVLASLALAAPALAANQLRFEANPKEKQIFSTRARVEMTIVDETNAAVEWHAEVAPAEAGHEPPPGSPSWKSAGGSLGPVQVTNTLLSVTLGHEPSSGDGSSPSVNGDLGIVHHLLSETPYYARFIATDGSEEAIQSVPFTTRGVAPPEIVKTEPRFNQTEPPFLSGGSLTPTSAAFISQVESNGASSHYEYSYSSSESGPWTPFTSGAGDVSVAEDFADPEGSTTGLTPESKYFVRLEASNEKGAASAVEQFSTPSAKPGAQIPQSRNITAVSAYITGSLVPRKSETHWRFEYSTSESGPWQLGPSGTVTQAEAEALPENNAAAGIEGRLSGLEPDRTYYVRLFAENECAEFCGSSTSPPAEFHTFGQPVATTFLIHALHGESLRVLGAVNPDSLPTSAEQTVTIEGGPSGGTFILSFEGNATGATGSGDLAEGSDLVTNLATSSGAFVTGEALSGPGVSPGTKITRVDDLHHTLTISGPANASDTGVALNADLPFDASADTVGGALNSLPTLGGINVSGHDGGPYTVYFGSGTPQPLLQADASGLTPSGFISVITTQIGGEAYDTHYHFEYETTAEAGAPFSHAASTPVVDLGVGKPEASDPSNPQTEYAGADLPALSPGETYRYRISATNTSPGEPDVNGSEQSLIAPTPAAVQPPEPCPNQALRTGPSARLPDCRAYEQLTPTDKEGAQEIYNYGGAIHGANAFEGTLPGANGDHLFFASKFVKWGAGPGAGQSPYFFTRDPAGGWRLTAATPQPEAGVQSYEAQVFNADLTNFAFESGFATSAASTSKEVEFKAGPPGGPYATIASLPRNQADNAGSGFIAASADFSKLILAVEDRKLAEPHSTTKEGDDLYEYSEGALRQVNVDSAGKTIGTCGAQMVNGEEGESPRSFSSLNAVSADGRHVFFLASPPASCATGTELSSGFGPSVNLYMRLDGGAPGAETVDIGAYRFLEADPQGSTLLIADPAGQLFRYDTATRQKEPLPAGETLIPRRYSYPEPGTGSGYRLPAEIAGFRVNEHFSFDPIPNRPSPGLARALFGSKEDLPEQIVRYDSAEHLIECLSCASSFDPEPSQRSIFGGGIEGAPTRPVASANGDYVFFDTPAALLPSDVDGEFSPGRGHGGSPEESDYSLSSDVYEWRRDGLEGCDRIQGCLTLITTGRGGYLNLLLGAAHEGRDVFFTTHESLLPRDNDTSGDIYDARIGGGFPEPVHPVECEGDACSHPVPAPNDPTPSSEQFHGAGNEHAEAPGKHKHHKKRHHKKAHKRHAKSNHGGEK